MDTYAEARLEPPPTPKVIRRGPRVFEQLGSSFYNKKAGGWLIYIYRHGLVHGYTPKIIKANEARMLY